MRLRALFLVLATTLTALPAAAQPVALPDPASAPPPPPVAPEPYPAPYAAQPPIWPPPLPVMERRSKALMGTGIALWALGMVATGVGAAVAIASQQTNANQAFSSSGNEQFNIGMGIIAGGVLGGLAGIPLFVIGNQKVPARAAVARLAEVRVGALAAHVRW